MFKNILLATDGSKLCNESVKAAIELAKNCGSRVVGLSVAEHVPALSLADISAGADVPQARHAGHAKAVANVELIANLAEKRGVPCTVQVTDGNQPYEEIIRVAEKEKCDAIFMASHGKTALERVFVGSQTQKILAKSKLPVVVFR